jgi:antitoxin FitA
MIDHGNHNPLVGGSNPPAATIYINGLRGAAHPSGASENIRGFTGASPTAGHPRIASITIRNLNEPLKSRLRIQAEVRGRSMEDEARDILRSSLNQEQQGPKNLGTAINALCKPFGGLDLPEMPREPTREPPTFDE